MWYIHKYANQDDLIEIKIEISEGVAITSLNVYMNNIISNDNVLRKYQMRRVVQNWGIKDKQYCYYMVAPPWCKLNPVNN
jgi:hypothetical protein